MYDPKLGYDYTVIDTPFLDPDFPPEAFPTYFMSSGSVVHAHIWLAQGKEVKGCAILSPQAFGGDCLESLIHPLLASGIHVLTFHPRGMWDDKHTYSFSNAIDDLHAAVEFLHSCVSDQRKTRNGKSYRIDLERIVPLGLSGGGGNVSYAVCAERNDLKFAIAIAPANIELFRDPKTREQAKDMFDSTKRMTAGRIDLEAWLAAMTDADFDRMSILKQVPNLVAKTLLMISSSYDTTSPLDVAHKRFDKAFREAGATNFTGVILESDHMFLTKRIALARVLISWLRSECGF
jgi:hypothetical protein